jgi:fatty-acid desaturase
VVVRDVRDNLLKVTAGWLTLVLMLAPVGVIFGVATGVWWPFFGYAVLVAVVGVWSTMWFLWDMRHFIGRQVAARRRRREMRRR